MMTKRVSGPSSGSTLYSCGSEEAALGSRLPGDARKVGEIDIHSEPTSSHWSAHGSKWRAFASYYMRAVHRIESTSALPLHWWRTPFVWSSAMASVDVEEVLANVMPSRATMEVHTEGLLTPSVSSGPSRMGLKRALRRLQSRGSDYAFLTVSPKHWKTLLSMLQFELNPDWFRRANLPEGECMAALAPANQSVRFESMLHWRMLALAGMAGGGMHLHADSPPLSNVHLQVRGLKRWALCPPRPGATQFYCAGAANAFKARSPDSPCPSFVNDSCYEAVLWPGEALFYPGRWWHQTQTLDDGAASLSRSLITVGDAAHFAPAMQRLCDESQRLNSHWAVCEALAPCLRRLSVIVDGADGRE